MIPLDYATWGRHATQMLRFKCCTRSKNCVNYVTDSNSTRKTNNTDSFFGVLFSKSILIDGDDETDYDTVTGIDSKPKKAKRIW